jgi:hypothetical protein
MDMWRATYPFSGARSLFRAKSFFVGDYDLRPSVMRWDAHFG